MKNLFEHIDNLLTYKKDHTLVNGESVPIFLTQRWISMYSPQLCNIINETSNTQYEAFDSEQDFYDYILAVVPKVKRKKINYIKKSKDKPDKDLIREANYLMMSVSELKEILKIDPDFLDKDKDIEIRKKKTKKS